MNHLGVDPRSGCLAAGFDVGWKLDGKNGPLAFRALNTDAPTVLVDDLPADG